MIEIDIHGMTVNMAKRTLERAIVNAPNDCKEIIVIHGFRSGTKLRDMVRSSTQLRSNRIVRRKMTMNQGETILVLK